MADSVNLNDLPLTEGQKAAVRAGLQRNAALLGAQLSGPVTVTVSGESGALIVDL